MPSTTRPVVVADASVALKWFHAAGEEGVDDALALLDAFGDRRIDLVVLDLTAYELGNALIRGAGLDASAATAVLDGLAEICDPIAMTAQERALAATLAADNDLTFYDAAYAAVASARQGSLATHDRALLRAGLGHRPIDVLRRIDIA
jgi:predicted nucleic acid-binding protein